MTMQVIRVAIRGVLLLLMGVAAACGDSPMTPAPPPPPPLAIPSRASVVIEDPYVTTHPVSFSDGLELEVRFLLRETSHNSGATIQSIFFTGDTRDGACTKGLYVPAGGVLDTFYTDEGIASLGYCSSDLGTITGPLSEFLSKYPMGITVVFVDDEGRRGTVSASALAR